MVGEVKMPGFTIVNDFKRAELLWSLWWTLFLLLNTYFGSGALSDLMLDLGLSKIIKWAHGVFFPISSPYPKPFPKPVGQS